MESICASPWSWQCTLRRPCVITDANKLQGFFGSGYFNEGNASPDNNYLKRIEGKKLLSSIEKSGLLSKADKAGLTLSKVCSASITCLVAVQSAAD